MKMFKTIMTMILAAATPLAAQETVAVTLDEAVSTALRQNNLLNAARMGVDKAVGMKKEADSYYFPQIDLSLAYSRTDNPVYVFMGKLTQERFSMMDFAIDNLNTPAPLTNYQGKVSLAMPIWTGGKISAAGRAAKLGITAAESMAKEAEEATRSGVTRAFFGALLAEEAVGVYQEAAETALAHEKRITAMHREGLVLDSDLLRMRVYLSEIQQELASRKADLEIAREYLAYAMGVTEKVTPEGDIASYIPPEKTLEMLSEAAQANRGELLALEARVKQAGEGVKIKKADYLPQVGLGASLERDYFNRSEYGKNWAVGVEVRIPVFDAGRRGGALMQARSDELQAASALADLRMKVLLEVKESYLKLKADEERIAVTAKALEQARENQRIVSKRYEEGMALVTELLDADILVTSTRLSRAKSYFDALSEKAALAAAVGGAHLLQ
ncbi:MAG TPA: TolC family protein [Acidobacteriota bacterium]|nr:TolC family protein [Acidobacteriota bacterium]HNT17221.1 TolC family protein [Acidobacteriota bacterium]